MRNHCLLKKWTAGFIFLLGAWLSAMAIDAPRGPNPNVITIDPSVPARPFPHFWEKMFGSGRAVLSLRDSYRSDLRAVKQITGLSYVRFHAIFHDEVGVYDEDTQGLAVYNFSYVDQIYDGLLANGVRPFVEIGLMPGKLAARNALQSFWYKPNVAPPKDWARWEDLIKAFVQHLVDRYGIDEVAQWYFEVWNEPNLDSWAGDPKQATYWDLYDHTAVAVKKVSSRLRVGGPATAQAAWVDAFLRHCAENNIPVDFASTHVYADDTAQDVFGTQENIPREAMVCRAVNKVHQQIKDSSRPDLPLFWTEFNASYKTEPEVTDSVFMGPWLANTIRQCDGLVDMMSYWTFSDVFEEQGVVKTPFYGGYGLIAAGGIPKPAFNAFNILHKLGDERIPLDSDSALLTRRQDGTLILAVWNYAPPEKAGAPRTFTVRLQKTQAKQAYVSRVDSDHGDFHAAYKGMGEPRYPTQMEIQKLRSAADLPAPELVPINGGEITLTLPSYGLAVVELR
jgi:xylan 1,4-beta-xylosidase